LNNYKIEPSPEIQRKIDYYFTPYIDKSKFQGEKHMKFEEVHEAKAVLLDHLGNLGQVYQDDPAQIGAKISEVGWTALYKFICRAKIIGKGSGDHKHSRHEFVNSKTI
jgi:hypothetical protein